MPWQRRTTLAVYNIAVERASRNREIYRRTGRENPYALVTHARGSMFTRFGEGTDTHSPAVRVAR